MGWGNTANVTPQNNQQNNQQQTPQSVLGEEQWPSLGSAMSGGQMQMPMSGQGKRPGGMGGSTNQSPMAGLPAGAMQWCRKPL